MNPELWDDLQDKTKSRECSFQSFQKNLIKGIMLVVQVASKVVNAKKSKEDSISLMMFTAFLSMLLLCWEILFTNFL